MHPRVVAIMRRMTPAERIQRASDMHRAAREMLESQVRSLHADWTDEQVRTEVRRRLLGGTD
jgi:hypothetical protein